MIYSFSTYIYGLMEQRTDHPQQSVEQQAQDKQHETKKLCLNMRFFEQKQTTQTANNRKQEHSNSEDETAVRHPPSSSSSSLADDTSAASRKDEGKDNHINGYEEKIEAPEVSSTTAEQREPTVVLPENDFIDDTTESESETAERAPPRQLYPIENQLTQMC